MKRSFLRGALLLSSVLCLLTSVQVGAADLSLTVANVGTSGQKGCHYATGTAGVDITAGQPLYFDTVTNTYKPCDNNLSLAASKVVGLACHGALATQSIRVCDKDPAWKIGAAVVIGDTIWTTGTAGGLTKTAADNVTGMYISSVGIANSTSTINLNITRADAVKP